MNPLQRSLGMVTASEALKQCTVQRVFSRQRRRKKMRRRLAAVCACLTLIAAGAGGWMIYQTPVSFISIDVNPSLELGLNRLDRVVQTTAYNEDGAAIANCLHLKNQPYRQAIDALFSNQLFQSYLTRDSSLVFTVVSQDENRLRREIQELAEYQAYHGQCYATDAACLGEAHENGLSVGKYLAFLELSYYDQTVTIEDCHTLTMNQLQQQIQQHCGHQEENQKVPCRAEETSGASETASLQSDNGSNPGSQYGYGHGYGHHGGHH